MKRSLIALLVGGALSTQAQVKVAADGTSLDRFVPENGTGTRS